MQNSSDTFQQRLSKVFNNATMAEIARRLDLPHATVRNYFHGRLPQSDVLIKIARETNVSLNWLLMGIGQMYTDPSKMADLGVMLENRIEQIIDKKLNYDRSRIFIDQPTNEGFDLATAVNKWNDPATIMQNWFTFEKREYPQDFGVVFFQGWESYTADEKIDALKDAKKVLDRAIKNSKN